MAHSTSFRFKAKPGERQAVIDSFQQWIEDRGPKVEGFVRAILTSSLDDPDDFTATVVFSSTETYQANSDAPETGAWFEKLRAHMVADPDWFNGNVVVEVSA